MQNVGVLNVETLSSRMDQPGDRFPGMEFECDDNAYADKKVLRDILKNYATMIDVIETGIAN